MSEVIVNNITDLFKYSISSHTSKAELEELKSTNYETNTVLPLYITLDYRTQQTDVFSVTYASGQ